MGVAFGGQLDSEKQTSKRCWPRRALVPRQEGGNGIPTPAPLARSGLGAAPLCSQDWRTVSGNPNDNT